MTGRPGPRLTADRGTAPELLPVCVTCGQRAEWRDVVPNAADNVTVDELVKPISYRHRDPCQPTPAT